MTESGLGLAVYPDVNGDGIVDTSNASYTDPDGAVANNTTANPSNTLANEAGTTTEVAYREVKDTDGDGVADGIDIDDDNDGILDVTERAQWENTVSDATLKVTKYVESSGAVATTTPYGTYTALTGGGSAGLTLRNLMDSKKLVAADTTYLYVLSPTGILERYTATTGAVQLSWTATTLTNGESGGETLASLSATNRIVGINSTTLYVLSDDSGKIESYTLGATAATAINYAAVTTATGISGSPTGLTGSYADLAAQGRILGLSGTAASGYVYILSNTGTIERYTVQTGAYLALTSATSFTNGDLSGENLLTAWQNGRLVSANGTDLIVFDAHSVLSDTDGDGTDDRLDLDSDNDGIADNIEAQTTAGYIAPGATFVDADHDGLNDVYDANTANTGTTASLGLTPVNTDAADRVDYLDSDSDNDNKLDSAESGKGLITDATYADVNGSINTPVSDLKNTFGNAAEVNFREAGDDTDGDGILNSIDIDDDNDGILDIVERQFPINTAESNGTFGEITAAEVSRNLATPVPNYSYAYPNSAAAQYAIISHATSTGFFAGAFWDGLYGHTTGSETDAYLAVNGDVAQSVFYSQTTTLSTNSQYKLSAWVANAVTTAGYPFEVGVRVFDTSTNTIIATGTSGSIASAQVNQWFESALTFNTGAKTQFRIEVYNISTTAAGNDFALDDITLTQIIPGAVASAISDVDGDGITNDLDLDSDNDGISDLRESGAAAAKIAADTNNDGTVSLAEAAAASGSSADVDGDGLMDIFDTDTSTANKTSNTASVGTLPLNTDVSTLFRTQS